MKVNGKDYPMYYGEKMVETTDQFMMYDIPLYYVRAIHHWTSWDEKQVCLAEFVMRSVFQFITIDNISNQNMTSVDISFY